MSEIDPPEPNEPEEFDEPTPETEPEADEDSPFEYAQLLLIVTGSHLRAEVADRPLAYHLRDQIQDWTDQHAELLTTQIEPVVLSDAWYINNQELHDRPTISLGGPGVNALSAYYSQKISPAMLEDDQMVIQLDPEFVDLRVCIWGMDHDQTVQSLAMFIQRYLDGYLRAVATQVEPG